MQIYFSANTRRSNEILQFLTIVLAIFLPLNVLAGLFGMNFSLMPLLKAGYGPWILKGAMLMSIAGLLIWFRQKQWM